MGNPSSVPPAIEPWRWRVVWLMFLATMINYMDRQALGSHSKFINAEFAPGRGGLRRRGVLFRPVVRPLPAPRRLPQRPPAAALALRRRPAAVVGGRLRHRPGPERRDADGLPRRAGRRRGVQLALRRRHR